MKKSKEDFFNEFIEELIKCESPLLDEFRIIVKKYSSREIYMWLESQSQKGALTPKIEALMTEFFYSIH